LTAALGVAVLVWTSLHVFAQQHDGPDFDIDSDKTLVFRPGPEPDRNPLYSSLSPDGTMRAETGEDSVRIVSSHGSELLCEISTPSRAKTPVFSSDGKTIVFAVWLGNLNERSDIYIHKLETGEQTRLEGRLGAVYRLALSGDGTRLAAAAVYGPSTASLTRKRFGRDLHGELAVFDLSTQAKLANMALEFPHSFRASGGDENLPHLPTHLALDQSGSTLVIASTSGLIRVVDVERGEQTITMQLNDAAGLGR
jgi:WD40 repeat protein